jgi:hypothetical protein
LLPAVARLGGRDYTCARREKERIEEKKREEKREQKIL